MWPTSLAFRAALHDSHLMVARAEILNADGSTLTLPITGGEVRFANDAQWRRSTTFTCVDPDGSIIDSDLLGPFGAEVRVWRGLRLPAGDELVPCGVFGVSDPDASIADDGSVSIAVTAYDRSRRVERAGFEDVWVIPAGSNPLAAIDALVRDAIPNVPAGNYMPTTATTPRLVYRPGDGRRTKAIADLEACCAGRFYFDQLGVPTVAPIPSAAAGPVIATYAQGVDAILLDASRSRSDEGTFSVVTVVSQSSYAAPVRSVAIDNDPASPTYVGGPFGRVPRTVVSSAIHTQAQADQLAAAELRKTLGTNEQVNLTGIVDPALDCDDVIAVTVGGLAVSNRYVITAGNVPLTHDGTQSLSTKLQSVGS